MLRRRPTAEFTTTPRATTGITIVPIVPAMSWNNDENVLIVTKPQGDPFKQRDTKLL